MKIKILIGILVFLIVLNLATLGGYAYYRWFANPHHDEAAERMNRHRDMKVPQLTPEQRREMRSLRKEFAGKIHPLIHEQMRLRGEIAEILMEEKIDTTAIFQRLDRIQTMQKEVENNSMRLLIESRAFLKPEQLAFIYRVMNIYGEPHGRHHKMMKKEMEKNKTEAKDSLNQ